ncbi:MAG: DUF2029 domain-containing protein [Chloroflexi bacterium]|nr:DUF2029 domain-containing protein [Chloroflexota bacterium]
MTRAHVVAAAWVVVAALAVPGITRWGELVSRPPAGDFLAYYRAAERFAAHDPTLYSAPPTDVPDYLYPPLFAALLQPLTWMLPATAQDIWQLASIGCALIAIVLVGRSMPRPLSTREWSLAFVTLALFPPFFRTVRTGQVVCILLLLVALGIWTASRRRDAWAGIAYAAGAAIKLYPALFLLTELARGKRTLFLAGVGAGLALTAASLWAGGLALHQSFVFELLPQVSAFVHTTPPNQSLAAFFARLGLEAHLLPGIIAALMLAATLWLAWRSGSTEPWLVLAMTTVLTVIMPARSWDLNYLLVLAPLLLLYFSDRLKVVTVAVYGLITLERYWPLMPDHWAFQSFALAGGLLLWTACAWTLWQKPVPHA